MTDGGLEARSRTAADLAALVRAHAEPLPPLDDADAFAAPFDRFAGAKVVLLGEASHGTSEFYRARAAITRRLVERHGFTIIAVEADWPDARRVDRFVRHHGPPSDEEQAFVRFPTWMWRNREVHEFLLWLRERNEALPADRRAEFRGLDVYGLRGSIAAVLEYLDRVDPEAAVRARDRYGCLTPWQLDPVHYGRMVRGGRREACEDAVVRQLEEILARRAEYAARDGDSWFEAAQAARGVLAAESYYRLMFRGSTESWNLRDRHMYDTLRRVMEARGPEARAVVWAHNSHIGNAAATRMGWEGQFNIGELCRTAFGGDAALIGFGTDRGTVAAADDWDEPMRVMQVRPARPDSYERVFRDAGLAASLTDLRGPGRRDLRAGLQDPRLERAIGVIYRPETERVSHYFEAVLPEQFDAFVWFEETRAVTPLATGAPHGVPETWPFGV